VKQPGVKQYLIWGYKKGQWGKEEGCLGLGLKTTPGATGPAENLRINQDNVKIEIAP